MKIVKMTNKDFKNIINLYKRTGAVGKSCVYPQHTYVSPATYSKIRKLTYTVFKKAYPNASKNKLAYAVELDLLNYGPCTLRGLPLDMMLVDIKSIEKENNGIKL